MTTGNSCSPAWILAIALRRSSSFTGTEAHPESRSWPRVAAAGWGAVSGDGVMGANLSPASHGRAGASAWRKGSSSGQHPAVRLRWFLGLSATLLLVVGLTVVISDGMGDDGGGSTQATDAGGPPTTGSQVLDDAGAIDVAGKVTAIHLEGAVLDPRDVHTPLTISSDRGFGNGGELTGVSVGGKGSSVVWDGGRPFVLSSGPGLRFDPGIVDLVDGEVSLGLQGGVATILEGSYQLDTPVAVGAAGIATPRDSVAFTAKAGARFEAHGDSALELPSEEQHSFTGPGLVHLEGTLEVTTENREQDATTLDLSNGPYELTLSPTEGGGWTISGRVQSKVVGDLHLGGTS